MNKEKLLTKLMRATRVYAEDVEKMLDEYRLALGEITYEIDEGYLYVRANEFEDSTRVMG